MNETNSSSTLQFGAFVGLDWADKEHTLSLCPSNDTQQRQRSTLKQTPETIVQWATELRTRFPNQLIAVALEQKKGPLLAALMQFEHIVPFPVNPKSLARFRQAIYPSSHKDDLVDADLLLEILLKHRDRLRPWQPDTVQTRQLALLNEQRRGFVDIRTAATNQLLAHLKMIFPQATQLVGSLATPLAAAFLKKWPTLQTIKKATAEEVRKFYYGHNSRSKARLTQRLELIKNAVPLTSDSALLDAHSIAIQALAAQLAALHPFIKKYDREIAELFASHPDAPIFDSLPGAGPLLAPRLLTFMGTDRGRFDESDSVSCYSGIAPVTEQSGKSRWVHMRWACPNFLRQTWHEFANSSIRYSPWARTCYEAYRKRNISHHEAVRKLAFKWQRIVWRMWKDGQTYDESRYQAALSSKAAPKPVDLPVAQKK